MKCRQLFASLQQIGIVRVSVLKGHEQVLTRLAGSRHVAGHRCAFRYSEICQPMDRCTPERSLPAENFLELRRRFLAPVQTQVRQAM